MEHDEINRLAGLLVHERRREKVRSAFRSLVRLPRIPILGLILLYQRTLSPDHGPLRRLFPNGYCRFYPSCSVYGYQAYDQHGVVKGTVLAVYRVLRCNPVNPGGIDPVPQKFSDIRHLPNHSKNQ